MLKTAVHIAVYLTSWEGGGYGTYTPQFRGILVDNVRLTLKLHHRGKHTLRRVTIHTHTHKHTHEATTTAVKLYAKFKYNIFELLQSPREPNKIFKRSPVAAADKVANKSSS